MNGAHSIENVLVLQGGGSLGAFGCGVFKALAESRVKIDILAGTSIGGVNAAIIAGSKNKRPEVALEQFWLELAENSIDLAPPPVMPSIPPPPTHNELEVTTAVTTNRQAYRLGTHCHSTAQHYMAIA
jgi:predicted acylesterase/phospholipase RssA